MKFTFNKQFMVLMFLLLNCFASYAANEYLLTKQITLKLTEAGTLPNKIASSEKNLVTNLKIIGEINGTDLRFIREMAGCDVEGYRTSGILSVLDLSEARFVAGGDNYYYSCYTSNDIIGKYAFCGCSSLTSVIIPSSVTEIEKYAFWGCSSLTSVNIPSSVTVIEYGTFGNCSSLISVKIPSNVTEIGEFAFSGCSSLTSVKIPSSVTSIGEFAFSGCSSLTSVNIPLRVTSIGESAFSDCSGLTSITIPSSVTSLGGSCFWSCLNLESVYFKGKYCNSRYTNLQMPTTSIIMVPTEYLQEYKDSFGPDYKYIYAWNPDETGDDNKPVTQCSTPSISYESGKLMFACETTGAKYHYTITDTDIKSDALSENGEVSLSAAYNISVYATADGYKASDKAEATLYWINANLDNGTNINMVKTRGVVASAHDGIICLSGLDNGEVVKFYATDGKYLGSSVAANGAASYAVNESLVIAKVGKDSIKIAVK